MRFLTVPGTPARLKVRPSGHLAWGNKWGDMPHGFQPIPADLDLLKVA